MSYLATLQQEDESFALWQAVQQVLRTQLSEPSFETWLAPLELIHINESEAVLTTESGFKRDWINKHYRSLMEEAFQSTIQSAGFQVTICLRDELGQGIKGNAIGASQCESSSLTIASTTAAKSKKQMTLPKNELANMSDAVQQRLLSPRTVHTHNASTNTPANITNAASHNPIPTRRLGSTLNPRYHFDNLVVGKHNQFCYAAALAIAENPGHSYNPFYVHGGVGLGKTHLIQSIGHFIEEFEPDKKVKYVTAEQFTNELITALGKKDWNTFRDRYRKVDVLIIDDIQFLGGKERTQQELFHTFNVLHEAGKQIILSSDRSPKHLPDLEDRLRSRFEWGLIAEIQTPDVETRIAILKKKSAAMGVLVPEPVLHYLAEVCSDNVRELEGALNKVTAYTMLTGTPLQLEAIQGILGVSASPQQLSLEQILEAVADYYHLTVGELKSASRARDLGLARQVATYLMRKLTDASFPKIGQVMGNRKHTTVLHAHKQLSKELPNQPQLQKQLQEIESQLRQKN